MSDAAHQRDAAQMLLVAYEEIKGSSAHPEDALEAARLASLPLAPIAIISRMRAVAQRNGVGWRPSRLRYFANPIADLAKNPSPEFVYSKPDLPAELPPLTGEDHEQSLAALQALETPEQRRRVELVGTLEPRPTFRELWYLLQAVPAQEFARRLQLARQRRKSAA